VSIRIVVADDHAIVREGLKQILGAQADFQVVAEASDGHEALKRVRELDFDVLLLDMSMPGKSGVELIKQVKAEKPKLRILVLTMHEEHQYAVRAIRAGRLGLPHQGRRLAQLVDRHPQGRLRRRVHQRRGGRAARAERHARCHRGAARTAFRPRVPGLSHDREGKSVSEIADRLNLSVKTVSTHKANVLAKMGLSTQGELIRYALENDLVEK
jgi:DNA-binding NarL/FixJ family response regulator